MLKRMLILLIGALLLLPLTPVLAVSSVTVFAERVGVVVNSFRISNGGESVDEYVEILNTGDAEVDLSKWKLKRKTASGSSSYLRTEIPADVKLAPGGKLKIAHPTCSCEYDLPYATLTGSTPNGLAPDNTIVLLNTANEVIDKVGYGKATDVEGKGIAQSPNDGEIYSRRDGLDTDNNLMDFYLSYTPPLEEEAPQPKPKTEAPKDLEDSTELLVTTGAQIRITEFMANPEGADTDGEWIEIYNAGDEANISSYIISDKMGSPKSYKLPKGTIIKAGQYLAFYSGKTPISLNNDDEAVEISTPDGKVISSTASSGKGSEGASFAFDGTGWVWTMKPTPGRANIIEKPKDEDGQEKGEVLALVDESELSAQIEANASQVGRRNDQILGYALIALAIVGAISYTLYTNKEKLREGYYKIRKRDHLPGSKIWQKIKGWRGLSSHR